MAVISATMMPARARLQRLVDSGEDERQRRWEAHGGQDVTRCGDKGVRRLHQLNVSPPPPAAVLMITGNTAAMTTRNTRNSKPMPSQMISDGISAIDGMANRKVRYGPTIHSHRLLTPTPMPNAIPSTTAIDSPAQDQDA